MSLKVKLTPRDAAQSALDRPLTLVSLGTALVLVTYVTPMATIPQTALDLGAGSGARAWILSSMSVGLAAALLASGAIGDAVGRRRAYVAGLLLLGLGSLGCARGARAAPCSWAPGSWRESGERPCSPAGWPCWPTRSASRPNGCAPRASGAPASGSASPRVRCWPPVSTSAPAGGRPTSSSGLVALALVLPSMRWLPESRAEHPRRLDVAGLVLLAVALTLLVSALTESRSGLSATTLLLFAGSAGRAGGVRRGRVARRRADARPGPAADAGLPRRHPRSAGARRRRHRDDLQRAHARAGRTGRLAVDGDLADHGLVGHQRRHLPARTPRPDPVWPDRP